MSKFREELRKTLNRIDSPGTFCVSGSMPLVLPGLSIKGVGPVGLPLNATQAKEVIERCEQAPYGKGEQTLVDTNVRKVWHMKPEQFTLTNPDWDGFIKEVLGKVKGGLGLEKEKLEAHLYDLLLYEPGSFFLPHRDSEKLPRMVATLVIVLPSSFKGGELVVRHDGQEQVIDASDDAAKFRVHYSAFYADCEHEIRPLREGHRLALVYNIVLTKGTTTIEAPRSTTHILPLRDTLNAWAASQDAPEKLAITLDHKYTADGLLWDALKGLDRARADVLLQAARQANWHIHLAQVTYHIHAAAEGGDWGYSRERTRSHAKGRYKIGEIYDTDLSAKHWSTPEGMRVQLHEMRLGKDDILNYDTIQTGEFEEEYEGYTGNAGETIDRWYRHGALVLWPEAMNFAITCGLGHLSNIKILANMVAQWKTATKDAQPLKSQCFAFASKVVTQRSQEESYYSDKEPCQLLVSLALLDDLDLIRRYLRDVLPKHLQLNLGDALVSVCEKHGWAALLPELLHNGRQTNSKSITRNFQLLGYFGKAKPRKESAEWQSSCEKLAEQATEVFEKFDIGVAANNIWDYKRLERKEPVSDLVTFLVAVGRVDLLDRVVTVLLKDSEHYPLTFHLEVLKGLRSWFAKNVKVKNAALSRWVAAVRERFEKLTALEPQRPADYRRGANLGCKCEFCVPFAKFLESPTEHTYRLSGGRHRPHIEGNHRTGEAGCEHLDRPNNEAADAGVRQECEDIRTRSGNVQG